MNVKQVTCSKEFKRGLPNYSNITVGMAMTVEFNQEEDPKIWAVWDEINQNLQSQTDLDPSWMKMTETKDAYKYSVKVPKSYGQPVQN